MAPVEASWSTSVRRTEIVARTSLSPETLAIVASYIAGERLSIPDYQSLMRPLLEFGADGREKNINEAIRHLADRFGLTPEEREQLLPSGKQPILANRVHWARTYLDKAG